MWCSTAELHLASLRQKVRNLNARRNVLEHLAMQHNDMLAAYLLERRLRKGASAAYYLSVPTPPQTGILRLRATWAAWCGSPFCARASTNFMLAIWPSSIPMIMTCGGGEACRAGGAAVPG